jgi:hypothetical protein
MTTNFDIPANVGGGAYATKINQALDLLDGLIFNVKAPNFGAVGDGVTDDTSAIQDAVDAANAAGGGTVYFPPGSYLVSRDGSDTWCLTLPSNVTLRGSGYASQILNAEQQITGADVPAVIKASSATNIAVKDLRITGDAIVSSLGDSYFGYGIFLTSVTGFTIDNVHFEYLRQGPFKLGEQEGGGGTCSHGVITNIFATGYRMCLGWICDAQDVVIKGLIGRSGEGIAVENGPCERIILDDLVLFHEDSVGVLGYAFQVVGNYGHMRNISYSNVVTTGNWLAGSRFITDGAFELTDISVSNCLVDGAGADHHECFAFQRTGTGAFSRLTCSNLFAIGSTRASGFRFEGVSNAMVSNCVAEYNLTHGFRVMSGATAYFANCWAVNNNVADAGNSGFHFSGSSAGFLVNCRSGGGGQVYGLASETGPNVVQAINCDLSGNVTADAQDPLMLALSSPSYLTAFAGDAAKEVLLGDVGGTATIRLGTDVNLYRSGANVLKTDDSLIIGALSSSAISLGAADSGGSGFKVLRVPN